MKLTHLLKGIVYHTVRPLQDTDEVMMITYDSREVTPGALFFSLKPLNKMHDPQPFILDAVKKGARYILKNQDIIIDIDKLGTDADKVVFIDVQETRLARTHMAANIYPLQPQKIAAVTGTNGKTSTVDFLRQIWEYNGLKTASIGSLGIQSNTSLDEIKQAYYATPDVFMLHQILNKLTENEVSHACLEASSHGIDQFRLERLNLTAAAFTNLSHEHLDYHGTLNAYFEAKRRLFSEVLSEGSVAVLNTDDFHYKTLLETCRVRGHQIITVGREAEDIQLIDANLTEHGQELEVKIFGQRYTIAIPLLGLVQGYNILTAVGLAIGCGLGEKDIIAALAHLRSVPGRFEYVGQHPSGGKVYVDYAHKAHALEMVLTSFKPHIAGQLKVVFGCGGDRDVQKRPMMGAIAAQHAHHVIITDDNPRHENPAEIRKQILQGCPHATVIADRRQAISQALKYLGTHDICVIAGKGHETTQIIGDETVPFDDRVVAREELKRLGGKAF